MSLGKEKPLPPTLNPSAQIADDRMKAHMTSPRPPQERRRHPRALTNFSGLLVAGARPYVTRIINLSMGGALLDFGGAMPDPAIQVGERLSLEIRCRGGMAPLRVDGKAVLWNRASSMTPLLAMQFDEVTGENAEILEDLMLEALSNLHERKVLGRR